MFGSKALPMILSAGATVVVGLQLWTWRADALKAEITNLEIQLASCKAQAANISEDKESDATIDAIPDDGLRDVPDRWMLRERLTPD